jgi:hypothetical protein
MPMHYVIYWTNEVMLVTEKMWLQTATQKVRD